MYKISIADFIWIKFVIIILDIFTIPEVVATVPVVMHTSFPGPHPSFKRERTSMGTATNARRNSTTARLINKRLEGVRICNVLNFGPG